MERVLDAGEELFATHPYRDVSVRQLADAAGVSHALVHRYFGCKLEVLRAVVRRAEGDLVAGARDAATVQDAVVAMLAPERMAQNRRYLMLMVRLVMAHMLLEVKPDGFPASRLLSDIARRQSDAVGGRVGDLDPAFVGGCGGGHGAGVRHSPGAAAAGRRPERCGARADGRAAQDGRAGVPGRRPAQSVATPAPPPPAGPAPLPRGQRPDLTGW